MDFLSTEVSTSKQKRFNMVTFVDTPGLVDGGMQYPFDVNEAILWLGEYLVNSFEIQVYLGICFPNFWSFMTFTVIYNSQNPP